MRRHGKQKGFIGFASRGLMLLAGSMLLLSCLSVFVDPSKAWWIAVLGVLYFPLVLLNGGLLVWAVIRWSKAAWIPLIPLLCALPLFGRVLQFSSGADDPTGEEVRIVSWNVGHFAQSGNRKIPDAAVCADSVARFLRACQADIICLQEVFTQDARSIRRELEARFPGYHFEYYMNLAPAGSYGNVTLSRQPILNKGKLDFPHSANLAVWTDHEIRGRRIRVYNCHLESYSLKWNGHDSTLVRTTEKKLRASIHRRPRQVEQVLSHMAEVRVPSVVAGDFNDSPVSFTYRKFLEGRQDAFVAAGRCIGATYRYIPFLRIDYVFCPPDAAVSSCRVERVKLSDHYPIITDINLFEHGKKESD
ncbi:MAG: endonuclease/exonuclease/phosphatase family protein [Bacteroidales bacterium]|nr:endonuclease/exonuclease/phosphatase family protein [Bacteroidales bacterium]MBR1894437.1 endonuclease/exonuclease/phosphatase family protein [Bacteroidales bacterium]